MSAYERISVRCGTDESILEWDGAQAAAPIIVDGEATRWQTADARHSLARAVRLVCADLWGPVYETEANAKAAGREPGVDMITIWDDVEYGPSEDGEDVS